MTYDLITYVNILFAGLNFYVMMVWCELFSIGFFLNAFASAFNALIVLNRVL